jgi:GGDEF domain-containing protein
VARIDGIDTDITERRRTEERLVYLSLHDSLTGLYNRAYFEQEMQRLELEPETEAGIVSVTWMV